MRRRLRNFAFLARYLAKELLRFAACMATVMLWFFLLLMLVPEAPAAHLSIGSGRRTFTRTARVTVYAPDEPRGDYWTRRHRAATGIRLRNGHCAVDPRRIPYGSTVIVAGRRLLAVDCGAFRGWHVDVFFGRWRDARRFDRATPDFLRVTVITPRG